MLKSGDTAPTRWIRISDPDSAARLLPAWFAPRMIVKRGSYGFLITTGDIVRVSRITSLHVSSGGTILIDVLLDRPGIPRDVDPAWQGKHFLGSPVPGAALATVNLDQIAMAVEFEAAEIAETENGVPAIFAASTLQLPHEETETPA
jgi:hypothetical protein